MNDSRRQQIQSLLTNSEAIVVLTGAGISAESGIPTFREAQTGLWSRYKPEELASPEAFQNHPRMVLEWYQWRINLISQARPNEGHHALVKLEHFARDHDKRFHLITQNIDNLHHRAGSSEVLELHGNILRNRCQDCGQTSSQVGLDIKPDQELPTCGSCKGLLRPDVVWFGESLPEKILDTAWKEAAACDIFLSIGTSTLVQPAASLPFLASDHGAVVVEINPQKTPLSAAADYVLRSPAGDVLPALMTNLTGCV